MTKPKIYIAEDDAGIRELYEGAFEGDYEAVLFPDAESFLKKFREEKPQLCILDIMLPDMDGYGILSELRKDEPFLPVIFVSAKSDEMSFVKGLNRGADDYMAKPFSVMELLARVKANLRRSGSRKAPEYLDLAVDKKDYSARVSGEDLGLTLKEFRLLELLVLKARVTVTREEMFEAAWGTGYIGETRTLDMHVSALREKLSEKGSQCKIVTVRGVGYRLE